MVGNWNSITEKKRIEDSNFLREFAHFFLADLFLSPIF